MQIVILSDVHNNEVNLGKVLDYCAREKITTLICCGDLASRDTLDFLNDSFSGNVYHVLGNMDEGQMGDFEFVPKYRSTFLFRDFGEFELPFPTSKKKITENQKDEDKIAFTHYPNIARKLAETGKYSHVFYGHTHRPWEEMIGKCKLLNPGNVTGDFYPPTFAVWNTEENNFKLIRIHDLI